MRRLSDGPVVPEQVRSTPESRPRRSRLPAWLVLLRPRQWVKNVFVLIVPLVVDPIALWQNGLVALSTTATFVAASSAVYVLNDWLDRDKDRLHPDKRYRPVASGRVSPLGAALLGVACVAVLLGCGAMLPPPVQATVAGYLVLNLAYCLKLKHYPLIDVSVVAAGFVLRAVAGCLAVAAPFNPALILCVYFTCLLMSLGKRRHELAGVRSLAVAQRPALTGYSVPLLDQLVAVLLAATLLSYEMFVLSGPEPQSAVLAVVTVPFVVFALCRYAYLLAAQRGGEPGQDVLTDVPLVVNAVVWLACLALGRVL
ncbi:4-hydroxybenzoate polyprenyltransferase [Lentzea albidocapillata subsp. violacea]|uniref:4-hydroxybenzoate polyprenyltransferase n=1 Tax=Lentzea albidocapillata subsp. violacea TaxID=128104 RepID=A0A1G8SHL6_9PSEU|nr:4-hydroxybenzoate polyprenyltransferase [Lentzea albidocapillata subsp. violacea]